MNRRQAITGVAAMGIAQTTRSADAHAEPVRYMQWTGYHWIEISDGIAVRVHDGEEWHDLSNVTLNQNQIESRNTF